MPPCSRDGQRPKYVLGAGHDTQITVGAFLEILTAICNIGTAVALYPLARRYAPRAALGYVALRIVESTIIVAGIVSVLAVLTLRQQFAGTGVDSETLTVAGQTLVAFHDWTFLLGPGFCAGIGNGLLLGYVMDVSGLLPRRLAAFGPGDGLGAHVRHLSDREGIHGSRAASRRTAKSGRTRRGSRLGPGTVRALVAAKRFLIAPVALLAFAAQSPETLTPEGPATLYSDWHGLMTAEGERPELLTGFRVVVQPGGRAGTIRFLVHQNPAFGGDGPRAVHVGDPVTLPAEPGTYTFPAPHVFADYRSVGYGIEQETGGHAITAQIRCSPEEGESDVCNSQSLDVYRPPLGAAVPDRRTASEVQRGRELTIEPITEPDVDLDGAGDETEDRTNLRASATTQRLSGHRRAFDITVENAGPRTADRPKVQASFFPSPGLGAWSPACVAGQRQFYSGAQDDDPRRQYCVLAPLGIGERRTVRLVVPDLGFGDAYFSLSAEGRDLANGDQDAGPEVRGPRPPLSLEVAARPEAISNGIPITVRSTRKRVVRLQVRRGSRTYARTITLRRAGKREVLLRPPRLLARENGVVTLTARAGSATARARLQPSY